MEPGNLTTAEVAARAGVHRDTLLRWLRQKKISEPQRNIYGWRVFTTQEADGIVAYARGLKNISLSVGTPTEIERLESLDWNFVNAKTGYLTHSLHPYPAKFIPQIPNALIQELSSVGETIADIFCGSGTTLVEALTLKRNAIGVDANPLACLISEAKTMLLNASELEKLRYVARLATEYADETAHEPGLLFAREPFHSNCFRPSHTAISFWFEPFIVEELAQILSWCRTIEDIAAQKVALAAFSAIIVSVSKQDSDTRYVRRDKNLCRGDAFRRFAKSLTDALRSVEEFTELVEPRFSCRVINSDLLTSPKVGPFDLVVCSPPYPNAYSYHLYHMTRMIWLSMDQAGFKKIEIGSHRKYSSKGATIETFLQEMRDIFSWLRDRLRIGRYACFVVGNSIINRRTFNNADLISDIAYQSGFLELSRISRQLQETRKSFNPAIGKIKTEQILILQRRNGAA